MMKEAMLQPYNLNLTMTTDSSGNYICGTYKLQYENHALNPRGICNLIPCVVGRLHKYWKSFVHHTNNVRDIVEHACHSGIHRDMVLAFCFRDEKAVCTFCMGIYSVYLSQSRGLGCPSLPFPCCLDVKLSLQNGCHWSVPMFGNP